MNKFEKNIKQNIRNNVVKKFKIFKILYKFEKI